MSNAIVRRQGASLTLGGFSKQDLRRVSYAAQADHAAHAVAGAVRRLWIKVFIGDPRINAAAYAASSQRMLVGRA